MTLKVGDLLPNPAIALYRPISREIYFSVVEYAGRGSALIGHLLNMALAAGSVYLTGSLVARLVGPRAGVVAGLIASCAAAIPFLIGWISGSQDLLCILFALVAFHLFERDHVLLGVLAFAAAVLSKETAVALAPAMLAMVLRPGPNIHARLKQSALGIGAILCAWALIHPWTRRLLAHEEVDRVNEYVAFRGAEVFSSLLRGLPSLLNLSWSRQHVWRADVIGLGIIASLVALVAIREVWKTTGFTTDQSGGSIPARLWAVGLLTIAGPFLLTSAFIAHWSPYYAVISVIGLALVGGALLARTRWFVAAICILAFLWAGIYSRLAVVEAEVPAEHNLRITASAMGRVERGFKALHTELPPESKVYLYIQAPGRHGIYMSLYRNQPLKVWYQDPSITVLDPLRLARSRGDEFLFWISPELDVFEVNTETLRPRTSGPKVPLYDYQKTLRAYALGLAGRGEIDRAVRILLGMPENSEVDMAYDRRSAAALLYAVGRDQEGDRIASTTSRFRRADALGEIAGLIAKPIPGIDFDEGALRAFEVAPTDTAALRYIMRWLDGKRYAESAARLARRLNRLVPGDQEAASLIAQETRSKPQGITTPEVQRLP